MHARVVTAALPGESTWIETAHGKLFGSWKGRDPVVAGEEVDVELTSNNPYSWTDIQAATDSRLGFHVIDESNQVEIVAQAVDYNDIYGLTIRAGSTLLSVDTEGEAPARIVGETLSLTVKDLEFYPMNL